MKVLKRFCMAWIYACFAMLCSVHELKSSTAESESLEAANLKKAIHCMELLEIEKDIDAFCVECLGENHIEHTPWFPDGKEALVDIFKRRFERYPNFTAEIKRAGADGDLVWIHMHTKRDPESRGNAVVNIFRMENGKFVEHWNVVQAVPEHSKNDNTMF